ncbi:MAG: RsmB/NOP family class I SAM-dependent RNA methyltransferase [Myxococcota bacterium]|nr:RsmB/NOP family class I SAM-dependent RNA methyltransferase [Myxococcota bacterium]
MRLDDADLRRAGDGLGLRSRVLAAVALLRAETDGAFPTLVVHSESERLGWNEPADRAAAIAIALAQGTLCRRGLLDARISSIARGGIEAIEPFMRQVLRVAAYEMIGPAHSAHYAAVHCAVEIVKRVRGRARAGFVNAVLRGIARDAAPVDADEAAQHALPVWLHARLETAWGTDAARALALWSLAEPAPTIRVNRGRASPDDIAATFPGSAPSPWTPFCLRLPAGSGDLNAHAAVRDGIASGQEEGAFLVTDAIPIARGDAFLDACAGRGNKTAAIAERAPEGVRIEAADVNARKLGQLAGEFRRLGLPQPVTRTVDWIAAGAGAEAGAPLVGAHKGRPYNVVLVDAPCTGTGTISRRPEIRWRIREDDVARLARVQDALLAATAARVAPGGLLVYAVCSLLPDEGERRIAALLSARPDLHAEPIFPSPPWTRTGAGAVLLPHLSGTDGFFAAALRAA